MKIGNLGVVFFHSVLSGIILIDTSKPLVFIINLTLVTLYYSSNGHISNHPTSDYVPYSALTSSHLRSIARPRQRWPPPPSAEDEVVALAKELTPDEVAQDQEREDDEVARRGTVDQLPIILEVSSPAAQNWASEAGSERSSVKTKSSNESLGPRTPENNVDENHDRGYIYLSQEGTGTAISYDQSHKPRRSSSIPHEIDSRGGKDITTLNTSIETAQGQTSVDSSRREPSPYAYTPSSNKGRYSGEYFLSPDAMYSTAWDQDSRKVRDTARSGRGKSADSKTDGYYCYPSQEGRSFSGPSPARPSAVRHHSAMADPGSRVRMEQTRPALDLDSSSDESDFEGYGERHSMRRNPSAVPRPSLRKASNPYYGGQSNWAVKNQSLPPERRTLSPRRKPVSAKDNRMPSSTLSSPSGLPPHTSLDLDAYFASNLLKKRNKPQRPSPLTSPFSSPPRSPRPEGVNAVNGMPPNGSRSRPTSRPASPLSAHPSPHHLSYLESNQITLAPSARDGHRSQRSSPLPSPEIKEYMPQPHPRIEVQAPQPGSGGRSYSYAGEGNLRWTSRRPTPRPTPSSLSTAQPGSRPRSRESYQRFSSYIEPKQNIPPVTNSPHLHPAPSSRSRPTTPSYPVDTANAPQSLPACPRPGFISGYNDWHMLIGRPNFAVCPSCMENVVGPGYNAWFARAPSRPPGVKTRCDFSSPWVRITWLKTLREKRQKADLLYAIASISEEPCPGKIGAPRAWHGLPDPDTGKPISNFDICPYCVRAIECIFPSLRGVFRYDHRQKPMKKRACDLRCDSKRFAGYIDRLEAIANRADIERKPPRMHRFADHAREMALLRECSRDDMVLDQAWHTLPQLPQFTVCEECYDDVVWPAIDSGSTLATKFNRSMQTMGPGGVSCQLYSPRMRQVFQDAVRSNDLAYLQQHAIKRYNVERSLQARHAQAKTYGDGAEIARIVQEWKNWE